MGSTQIPFLDLIRPHLEMEEELVTVFRTALHNRWIHRGQSGRGF